ncbi:MAG: phosphoribosylamine--glycine ligase [Alphaproteobacteria bacterium]
MKILVVGSGGREHALCWALSASPLCEAIIAAPGNAGIAEIAECVAVAADDVEGLVALARDRAIDLVVIGPEAPLVLGLADALREEGIRAFGPSARAARLEGSKGFMKDLANKYGIPTAAYGRFHDAEAAIRFIREKGAPIVVKADGLAAGKGVILADSEAEAIEAVREMMAGDRFGEAGREVVIEERLRGEEVSFFALVDGETALPLASAQDHKAVGEGDTGPNTGGMGAYSPAPIMTDALAEEVMATIITPTVAAMKAEGCPFEGVLFAGLMVDENGPKLLEFNVRFGDPECQALMMRLRSDLLTALVAATDGELADFDMRWDPRTALCVVMAARGYPGSYERNTEIRNLAAAQDDDVVVFHAGTSRRDGRLVATGGRVLGVTARGQNAREAQVRAYAAVDRIDWPGGFCRRDIGWRAVERTGADERADST